MPQGPLGVAEPGYRGVRPFTIGGASVQLGRGVQIIATIAGDVTLTMADGSSNIVPVAVGITVLPFSVRGASASTATATYAGLI